MGAAEVGMLAALLERGVQPDLIVGTSVGALNGAALAADPSIATVDRLRSLWVDLEKEDIFEDTMLLGATKLVRRRTHLHSNARLRALVETTMAPASRFEDLMVPFQCVAACIERAAEHWFHSGPLADAILASAAVPGLLPPVVVDGEHFVDGGVVNSIPISRAVELGATDIYVMHVGRIERALEPPRNLLQVAMVAFEIARRHRFARDIATLPEGVVAHVLPTGDDPPRPTDLSQLKYGDFRDVGRRIAAAHRATAGYLATEG